MPQRAPVPTAPAWMFLAFVLALLASMLFAAVASPWVQAMLSPLAVFPLHRVFSRLTMLGVIVVTVWLLLHYRLADRGLLGFDAPWPRFVRRALVGLAAGLALMAIALVSLFLLDVREWNGRAPAEWS